MCGYYEFKPRGVYVTVVPPPLTNTAVLAKLGFDPRTMPMKPMSVQAAGIAASEQALAKYAGALNGIAQARQIKQQSMERQRATQTAFKAGESDRVALNGSRLQVVVADIAEQDAIYRAQQALGALEDSVERPLLPGDLKPLTPQSQVLRERGKNP